MVLWLRRILWVVLVVVAILVVCWLRGDKSQAPGTVTANVPVDKSLIQARMDQADELASQEKWLEARAIYSEVLERYSHTEFGTQAEAKMSAIGLPAYFEELDDTNSVGYTVEPGDHLTKIAKQFGITAGTVMLANGLTTDRIRPGMELKVMTDPWNMLVDKSRNVLFLKAGERVVKTYSVASGKDNSTPAGDFKIINRLTDPTWYYEGTVAGPGSPDNPLGTRWMGFDLEGYGLHGTTDPDAIGQYATLGCLRMHDGDIEELFELVGVGTPISIIE